MNLLAGDGVWGATGSICFRRYSEVLLSGFIKVPQRDGGRVTKNFYAEAN